MDRDTLHVLLALILVAALLSRVWALGDVPKGVYADEAAVAYDAYSVLHTGADSHSHVLPLFFESFGEYKNPVYIYATVPFVALLGLNPLAARLPAALFGTLAVLAAFLLARELFDERVGLLAALFTALSPWAFQFSRIAFEAAALPAVLLLATFLFVRGTKPKRDVELWAAAALFSLSAYTYGSARLFAPLFQGCLVLVYHRELLAKPRAGLAAAAVGLLVALPLLYALVFTPQVALARFDVVSVFAPGHQGISEFLQNLPHYYDYHFLFVQGDHNLRHSLSGVGELQPYLAPLLLVGFGALLAALLAALYSLVFKRKKFARALTSAQPALVVLAWLAFFAVPAALTWDGTPHALRAITGVGLFELVAAFGAVALYDYAKKNAHWRVPKLALVALTFLFFAWVGWSTANHYQLYFNTYPSQSAAWFESGLPDAFAYIGQHQNEYASIRLTPQIDQAYMYALFYLQISPAQYQREGLGKLVVCDPPYCPSVSPGSALYLKRANPWQPDSNAVYTSRNPDGSPAFELVRQ